MPNIRRVKARALALRSVAFLAAGAATVHQLRYALGYGSDASHALSAQGHAYMDVLLPFLVAAGLVALAAMARTPLAGREERRLSARRTWGAAFAALVVAYCAQELLEGLLASGHPAGLAGVFGGSGWLAVPIAAVVALLVAIGIRGNGALDAPAATIRPGALPAPSVVVPVFAPAAAHAPARPAAARGPPRLLPV
jgi:hypothetical protein